MSRRMLVTLDDLFQDIEILIMKIKREALKHNTMSLNEYLDTIIRDEDLSKPGGTTRVKILHKLKENIRQNRKAQDLLHFVNLSDTCFKYKDG